MLKLSEPKATTPFYKGSQLHYFHIGKMHTCRKGKASNLRSADEDQLISKFNKAAMLTLPNSRNCVTLHSGDITAAVVF